MFFLQLLIYGAGIQLKPGELADTDCYMRMVRVEEWTQTHEWFDRCIERSNAPFGETTHWGRLLDVLIRGVSVPFAMLLPSKTALFYAGVLISPLLLIVASFALFWTSLAFKKKIERPHLLLLFFSQASVVIFFQAGRPDHHSLLLVLFIVSLGFLFRLLQSRATAAVAVACALTEALAFAVSLESIITIALTLGLVSFAWIRGQLRPFLGLVFSGTLFVFSGLLYLSEQPWNHLATVELDRMTLPHLVILALAFGYWLLVSVFDKHVFASTASRRAGLTLTYGTICALVLLTFFPMLLQGPYGQMDPRLKDLWLRHVLEVQSLWQTEPGGFTSLLIWLSPALVVGGALCFLAVKKSPSSDYHSWPWLAILAGSALFTLLTFYQIRWAAYAQTCLIFPFCALLGEILRRLQNKLSLSSFGWARLALLLLFCAGYVPIAALTLGPRLLAQNNAAGLSPMEEPTASAASLCQWMEKSGRFPGRERILAHLDLGPELLYRTSHEVIASPYHRNGEGILFFYDVMNERSEDTVRRKLEERGVTLLLLEPDSSEKAFLNQSGSQGTLYQQCIEGNPPSYFRPVEIPKALEKTFRLYRFLRRSDSDAKS